MLGGILFIVSLPEMISGFYDGHDMAFHLLRIEGIAQELKNGSFPARIHSLSLYGYGYPVSIFYGDILLYLPAMLRIVGVPVMSAYKVYILFINVLTMLISYFSFSKMFKNRNVAVLGTLIYVTSPYRMLDVYIRAAVGEYTAMMAYPLIALALYLIYTSDAADWKKIQGEQSVSCTWNVTVDFKPCPFDGNDSFYACCSMPGIMEKDVKEKYTACVWTGCSRDVSAVCVFYCSVFGLLHQCRCKNYRSCSE